MQTWMGSLIIVLALTNLLLMGSSRIDLGIRFVALQGVLVGSLPFFMIAEGINGHVLFLGAVNILLKGFVFPRLLTRALRETEIRREIEPFIGYSASFVIGVFAFGLSVWMGAHLPAPMAMPDPLLIPGAFFTIIVGLFLLINRKKALSQVLGYLALENGIFMFGIPLASLQPFLVELGVLLDVFMAVFVMGIIIFHINREFDHIETDRLTTLKDWTG